MIGVLSDFLNAATRWRTWFLLGNQDIMLRYKRSVIGPFWISMSLAAMVAGLALLYSQIFQIDFRDYLFWLACSLLVWTLLSSIMNEAGNMFQEAEGPLKNVKIAQSVLAMRIVYRQLIVFVHNFIVIVGLMLIFGFIPNNNFVYILPGLLLLLAIGFFYCLSVSALCLRFRDVSQVITNAVSIMFFLTPVIWMPSQGRVEPLFILLNPLYHILELVRAPLLGEVPTMINWTVSLGVMGALMVAASISIAASRGRLFMWL
jgi:ABC-type polysaccharide/polyol phosphate export permease